MDGLEGFIMPISPETIEIAYKSLVEQGLLLPVIISSLTAVFGGNAVLKWLEKKSNGEGE